MVRVVAALFIDGDRFMVTQRLRDCSRHPDQWEFPGGKVEPGEDDQQALVREIQEELGVEIEVEQPYAQVDDALDEHRRLDFNLYRCRLLQGTPRPLEVQNIRWVTLDEAEQLRVPPVDRAVIVRIRRDALV